ncbi:MAG TPA: DUF4442 domain-containing protein [Salinisphaeraceae bacterium]|nr:DUF4442 domain-containing protein [Salinisphaeraceae bacterium]
MSANNRLLAIWRKTSKSPGGKRVFSRLVCLDAPYCASLKPVFEVVQPGHVEVGMRRRRAVRDHAGDVHTMALCNLAELAARTLAEVTLPASHGWLVSAVAAEYLQPATSAVLAVARARLATAAEQHEQSVPVEVRDLQAILVCRVRITLQIAPQRQGTLRRHGPASRLHRPVLGA